MKVSVSNSPKIIPMKDMRQGEFAVITSDSGYEGSIVFRAGHGFSSKDAENEFVAFMNSGEIDSFAENCPNMVRVLQPGESFTITV